MTANWRTFTVFLTANCRACYLQGKRGKEDLPSFAQAVCEETGIWPYWKVPHIDVRIAGHVRRHYKTVHPEWPYVVK